MRSRPPSRRTWRRPTWASTIRFAAIEQAFGQLAAQSDCVVVEGVGGWRVPLGPDGDVADLAMRLKLPVVLVVGLRLGCLNHAALTAADIRRCGLPLAGWVGNAVEAGFERLDDNLQGAWATACRHRVWAWCATLPQATPDSVARDLRVPLAVVP